MSRFFAPKKIISPLPWLCDSQRLCNWVKLCLCSAEGLLVPSVSMVTSLQIAASVKFLHKIRFSKGSIFFVFKGVTVIFSNSVAVEEYRCVKLLQHASLL